MIISATEVSASEPLRADVVVVGAGAAGIPLALKMADSGLRVLLFESGDESLRDENQALFRGKIVDGSLHPPADKYRQRRLGGTTGVWGGRCVPLDPIDIEPRDYVPDSGWPIEFNALNTYYDAANDWLEAGQNDYSSERVFPDPQTPMMRGFGSDKVSCDSLERFSRPTDLYARYQRRLQVSPNLTVVFGANCTNVSLDNTAQYVDKLDFSTMGGVQFSATGEQYVLATGGIETARILLASNNVQKCGVGNENDVVGRYYMCHIAGNVGQLTFAVDTASIRHGYEVSREGVYCRRRISLVAEEQRNRQANNVILRLHFPRVADPVHRSGVLSLIFLLKPFISYEYATRLRDGSPGGISTTLGHLRNVLLSPLETTRFLWMWATKRILASRKFPSIILENKSNRFSLEVNAEQTPNRDSRISLMDECDELGMPRVSIDWRYSTQDIESVGKTLDTVGAELNRTGMGKLEYDKTSLEKELLRFGAYGGHHIGTTRMGTDPKTSVVDENCRIHSVKNLYVAGSAVFPTSGQANPTLTTTALALRLGDHLAKKFRSGVQLVETNS